MTAGVGGVASSICNTTRYSWVVSFTLQPLLTRFPLNKRLVEPQCRSGHFGGKKNALRLLGSRRSLVSSAQSGSFVDWTTVAHLDCFGFYQIFECSWYALSVRVLSSFLGAFAKLRKATISFVMSVCLSVRPHGTTRLPLDGFLWNLIFEDFSKICRENSSFIKIGQEYVRTGIHF